ncbi:hypothetical protein [Desulfofustis glycolicus]|uniref:Winged helix-turn-helix DNA-binding n=1 Tax=Desulfofustis glycolicus DSM 9705 TaxID=1121409 RepID=A0A1M5VHX9_9BACT|nr:hypothetical protein [Desulfofustis glycolicus]MCB2217602.1 hypothetical protein [Desulfobulbaceae bacterium]SHH74882.1 hypothetical protein SAMN02745124_01710 [Desulfofustis glycolicus DSM 9705]
MKTAETKGGDELTEEQRTILKALSRAGAPCGAKEIAATTGLESKLITSCLTTLKKTGLIDSPVRCKYTLTPTGRALL